MNPKKAGYRKGTSAVAGDVGRIAANIFWGAILGGSAGGLAARSWRGALIGALSTSAIAVGVLGSRATVEGRWMGTVLAVASAAGALGLSFASSGASTSPTADTSPTTGTQPSTAGLGAAPIMRLGAAPVLRLGAARVVVYGHPMGAHRG